MAAHSTAGSARDRASVVAAQFHERWATLLRDQPGNPAGVGLRPFSDDLVATRAEHEPDVRWLQHVAGFAERHVPLLDGIVEWFGERSLPFRLEADADVVDTLVTRGGVEAEPIDLLTGEAFATVPADGIAIDGVDASTAARFAAVLLAGHQVDPPPPHVAAVAGFAGSPGMRCFLASVDGRPAGAGVLVVEDGVGYLANASTTPSARGKGVQTALIGTRLRAAADAGCDLFASMAIPGTPSHRNLVRAGLQPVEHRRFVHFH